MSAALLPELVVNGTIIPAAAISAEAQNHHAPKGKPGLAWRKAARALAVRQLLLEEAQRRGIVATCEDLGAGKSETEDEALIRALLEEALEAPEPSEEMVRAEWAKEPDRYRAPPLWEVSHILCACDPGEHEAASAARIRAELLIEALNKGARRFADLAASDSDCGSKANGGTLGQLGPGDTVPEFEAVLRQLPEGEITQEPVRTRFGWHVVRMDACAEGQVLPYEVVRPKLAEAMEKAAWTEAARAFVDELVAAAKISGPDIRAL
ncbi:peptidylprolyl isomerase [Frigidibacter sp. ROC022]|uniref:peptidylprolyl isomerase n=1 Tax=Frigidibacter sp. ROC022 TaxID=2971796 RepID=UPI00215A87BC|nr:peptidylprolyl isomerase [Frigidibacter sp. ROC022]MCR8726019.1 peptidylprolyl isomerase [Frigidibacter sp. ROC022]